jgi:transposase-like protein
VQVLRSQLDEKECVHILRQLRWPDGPICPYCISYDVIRSGRHFGPYQRYKCKSCTRIFNDRTHTIFEGSRAPLSKWFYAAAMLKDSESVMEISRRLGIWYDTTYRMVKKLRKGEYWLRMNEVADEYVAAKYGGSGTLGVLPVLTEAKNNQVNHLLRRRRALLPHLIA